MIKPPFEKGGFLNISYKKFYIIIAPAPGLNIYVTSAEKSFFVILLLIVY